MPRLRQQVASHPAWKGEEEKKEPAPPEEPVKKFGPEAKAARAEAARAAALEQAQKQAAAATQKAKEAEARAKQAELKLAANKLEMEREEQKRQKAWAEREKKLIAARNVGGQGSGRSDRDRDRDRIHRGKRWAVRGYRRRLLSRRRARSDDRAREDYDPEHDRASGREPRGASLWDHVEVARARTSPHVPESGSAAPYGPRRERAVLGNRVRAAGQHPGAALGSADGVGK